MRKLIVSEFVTLDGIMQAPGPDGSYPKAGWSMPYGNEQFMKFKLEEVQAAAALLLGRVTYEGFAEAWPGRTDEAGFADKMNTMPKYVVSKTLKRPKWDNTHVLDGDLAQAVTNLKAEPGGEILVNGSADLVAALMEHGLVDEFRLLVYPVIVGSGKRLFEQGGEAALELTACERFDTGVVLLTYVPAQ